MMDLRRILLLLLVMFQMKSLSSQAQIRYNGPTIQMESPVTVSGLQFAGVAFKDIGMKFPGCDTLNNAKMCFTRTTLGQIKELKLTVIVRKGVMVQFQINTSDPEQAKSLENLCMKFYGKPKKSTATKNVNMVSWESERNGKNIQTFLIVANHYKKAELVSWVVN